MTRIATPDNEEYLLMIARHGTAAHVEQAVRAYRHVDRLQATAQANAAHALRSCTWYYEDDGMLVLKARLPAEAGAAIVEALAAASEDLHRDVSAGTCVPAWAGERMDLDRVVAGLMQGDKRTTAMQI